MRYTFFKASEDEFLGGRTVGDAGPYNGSFVIFNLCLKKAYCERLCFRKYITCGREGACSRRFSK